MSDKLSVSLCLNEVVSGDGKDDDDNDDDDDEVVII
jgi:hypothetical protein